MHQTQKGSFRWFIVFLLFLATCINYLDRQIIGLLKPLLEKEFNWSEKDFGFIVMSFTAAYAVGLLLSGKIIDVVGTKKGYIISVVIWSVAGMLHAVAGSAAGFAFARMALGIGEAGNFPAAVKAVAEWFPVKERALANGLFNSGTSVGVVGALLIVPVILNFYGWPEVFIITGGLGFLWLILWLAFYQVPEKSKRISPGELEYIKAGQLPPATEQEKIGWVRLFSYRGTWALIAGKGLIDPIYWFFLFWLPSYFSTTFVLDLKKPSVELMIIYAATTVGSIGGGVLSSAFVKRGWPVLKARKFSLLLFAFLEVSIILTPYAHNVWLAVALISTAVAVHQAWATNIFTLAADLFPRNAVSSVVGIAGMAGAIGGIAFPLFVGYLLDAYKTAGNLQGGYNVLFTICGCTYLVVWAIIHLLTRTSKG